jgi:hypothetical protein
MNNGATMYINVKNRTLRGKVYIVTKRQDGSLRKKFIDYQRPFNNLTSRFNQLVMFRERYYRTYHDIMWPYNKIYNWDEKGLSLEFPKLNLTYDEPPSGEYTEWVAPAWISAILENIREEKLYGPTTIPPQNTDMSYLASSVENYM